MLYLTADLHLGEDRLEMMQRPFSSTDEMEKAILNNFSHLTEKDTLIINGDVCKIGHENRISFLNEIKAEKILIRGNHDRNLEKEELEKYFIKVLEEGDGLYLDIGDLKCYVTHYPTMSVPNRFNLVGHIHSAFKVQLNMFNVGVDVNHFRPVSEEYVKFIFGAICNFYDDDVWVSDHPANAAFKGVRGKKEVRFKNNTHSIGEQHGRK